MSSLCMLHRLLHPSVEHLREKVFQSRSLHGATDVEKVAAWVPPPPRSPPWPGGAQQNTVLLIL